MSGARVCVAEGRGQFEPRATLVVGPPARHSFLLWSPSNETGGLAGTYRESALRDDVATRASYETAVAKRSYLLVGVLVAIGLLVALATTRPPGVKQGIDGSGEGPAPATGVAGELDVARRSVLRAPAASEGDERGVTWDDEDQAGQGAVAAPRQDRKRADEIRELLEAMYAGQLSGEADQEQESGEVAAGGGGSPPDASVPVYVNRMLQTHFVPLASSCYEQLLERATAAQGAVVLELSIMGDPSVGGVVVDVGFGAGTKLNDPMFTGCVRESLYAVVFDPPPTGHPTLTVRQELDFSP